MHVASPFAVTAPVRRIIGGRLGLTDRRVRALLAGATITDTRGRGLSPDDPIEAGGCLALTLPADPVPPGLPPVPVPVRVVYEDAWLLVAVKPPRLPSHPSADAATDTLGHRLVAHLADHGRQGTPHLVSRLDRPVSGLVLVAKHGVVHGWFQRHRHLGVLRHLYLGRTDRTPAVTSGVIDLSLARAPQSFLRRIPDPAGLPARTRFRVLSRGRRVRVNGDGDGAEGGAEGGVTWVEGGGPGSSAPPSALVALWPITGRTHQLRAHLAAIGCPLCGDFLYGVERADFRRVALHAAGLSFVHPANGRRYRFRSPLPACMTGLAAAPD